MCVLYYSYGDTKSIQHLIDNSKGTHQNKESNRDNLNRVLQFCLNVTDCRRTQVLAYFGEDFPRHKCHKTCDVCFKGDRLEQRDVTKLAKAATQLVQEIQSHAGITLKFCLSILRGARLKKVSRPFSCIVLYWLLMHRGMMSECRLLRRVTMNLQLLEPRSSST